jgi:Fe-S-cluster-containing hydrogenase component 2
MLTAGKCELIKIMRDDFLDLCRRYPQIEASARKVIGQRFEQEHTVTPEISELLERSGQLGVIQADALLVMDLDLCIKCDACVKACESLHGKSRLIRNGIQLGKYLVPSACRHCDDPKCMNSCPTGAIKRRPEGEIYFQYDMCIGCGNCAIACPYDNIAMIDTPTFDKAQARESHTMNDPYFFRPYPVASHDVAETGLREHLFGFSGKKSAIAQTGRIDGGGRTRARAGGLSDQVRLVRRAAVHGMRAQLSDRCGDEDRSREALRRDRCDQCGLARAQGQRR